MSDAEHAVAGIAFAAIIVWLTVRIVNRNERWAKRGAIALTAVFLYPLSFGPACWIASGFDCGEDAIRVAYRPLFGIIQGHGPRVVQKCLHRYAEWGVPAGHYLFRPNERMTMAAGWDIFDLRVSWLILLAVSMGAAWIGLCRLRSRGGTDTPEESRR